MSSRLFQSVREEKGLAYDVSSYVVDYADAGAFVVSAGVDPDRIAPPWRRSWASWPVSATRPCRPTSWPLEALPGRPARAADGGDAPSGLLAGRAGSAPRPKVLTLDQALAELNAVTSEGIHVAPPRRGRRFESLLRLPGGVA
jgi:hypothetical protein